MKRGRAWRRHQRNRVISNRMRDARAMMDDYTLTPRRVGQMAHMHPLDCGNARCLVCHPSKTLKLSDKRKEQR